MHLTGQDASIRSIPPEDKNEEDARFVVRRRSLANLSLDQSTLHPEVYPLGLALPPPLLLKHLLGSFPSRCRLQHVVSSGGTNVLD